MYIKEIGGEWLVKQAFETLEMDKILKAAKLDDNLIETVQILFTAKLLHPSNVLETERWLCENSAANELYKTQENMSRYKLYKAATSMYSEKEPIEKMKTFTLNNAPDQQKANRLFSIV